mmetsp:Transcript_27929/g.35006  ORF Transcript_27929/g.35006 Transcript_27929/m.35006 type:complete len:459 (+) Transcript_27929:36-1412(+)
MGKRNKAKKPQISEDCMTTNKDSIYETRDSENSELNNPSTRGFLHCGFSGDLGLGCQASDTPPDESELCRDFDNQIVDESRSTEERIQIVRKLFTEKVQSARALEKQLASFEHQCNQLAMKSEYLNTELSRVRTASAQESKAKQKIEALCRELQKQNKTLQEETTRVSQEEEAKRNELQTKFNATIKDITSKLEEQGQQRKQQGEENGELRKKLDQFVEQYEARQRHFAAQTRTRELEAQLLRAKLEQQAQLATQEKGKAQAYQEHITQLAATEAELRSQLALYAEKFDQFQEALNKSNDMFSQFKVKMEKMAETIGKLEADNGSLKKQGEASDVRLIQALDRRTQDRAQIATLKNQKAKLEILCRTMQTERSKHAIEIASLEKEIRKLESGEPLSEEGSGESEGEDHFHGHRHPMDARRKLRQERKRGRKKIDVKLKVPPACMKSTSRSIDDSSIDP